MINGTVFLHMLNKSTTVYAKLAQNINRWMGRLEIWRWLPRYDRIICDHLLFAGAVQLAYCFGRCATSSISSLASGIYRRLICTQVAAGKSPL